MTTTETSQKHENESREKPGFFKRLFKKLDASMKEKAEKQAEEGCCCDSGKDKGGKCC
ncbi:MAG: hypothetical protein ACP5I4_03305 [Oceanipulchritudo sp.]